MDKPKLAGFLALCTLLSIPVGSSSVPSYGGLVDVSTRFIDVPASEFDSDTVRLAATLYQPRFLISAPAAVYIHGWGGRRLTGTDNLAYYVAAAGYVVISYTARGFGDGESGGQVTLAGPNELDDLRRVIDWLTADPDGAIGPRVTKIGVIGGSYGGGHSFQISSDPRVSAVIPLVGWTDLEQSLFPNGAINYSVGIGQFYSGLNTTVGQPPYFNYSKLQFDMFDAAAEGRRPDPVVRQELRDRSIAQFNGEGREMLDPSRQPRVPVFIIQSWDDYLFPAAQVLDVYSQITAPKQIYLGRTGHPPGGHTVAGEELYIGTQVLRWFDHHLRGIGGADSQTITSAAAPFPAVPFTGQQLPSDVFSMFLKPDGVLLPKKKGPNHHQTAGGVFHPERIRSSHLGMEIPSRGDMLSGRTEPLGATQPALQYTSRPFAAATEMIGSSEFTFFVSSTTSTDVDLIVRTYDVAEDGTETEVTLGAARVTGLSSGEIRAVTFRDYGDNWVFRTGHSLRIKVSNIDFPSFRPPGANDNLPSEITVHGGKRYPSRITLTVRAG